MDLKRIEGRPKNLLHPLPSDYADLTPEGQRLARLNAARQWLLPTEDLKQKALDFIASLNFFEKYYLWPDEAADFNPLFFDDMPVATPLGHYSIYKEWATSKSSLVVAPRGFAKSSCIRKSMLMQLLTRPANSFIYATSSHDNAQQTAQIVKSQLTDNKRIFDDFSPDFPDERIVPRRGEASFGLEMMYLKNGSWLRAISASSKQRGGRPRCYILDDPEYDAKASTSMSVLRDYVETLLFKIILPMLMRPDTSVRWLATFVSRRHYAWHAMQTEQTASGLRAQDPRFEFWSRMLLDAEYEKNGIMHSCWPEMWPLNREAKRLNPKLKNQLSLEEIKERLGSSVYLAEYRGRPGESGENFFPLMTRDKHGWWLENVDVDMASQPYNSQTSICWDSAGIQKSRPIREFLQESRLFMSIDTSFTHGTDSDYKVCTVMAATSDNCLFVLDMWAGKTPENELIRQVFRMADKWRVPTIHPEVIRESASLYQQLESLVRQRATEMTGTTHLPRVVPLRVGMMQKEGKISTLMFRFEHGLIKMPLWQRMEKPWRDLFDQIEQFNPEAKNGGLSHDDHIDTVSMSTIIMRFRIPKVGGSDDDQTSSMDLLRKGTLLDPNGIPILASLDFNRISPDDVQHLLVNKESDGSSRV
jgi:predicted phage terminase large subunit-like protein